MTLFPVHADTRRYDTDIDLMGMDRATLAKLAETCQVAIPDPNICDACAARLLLRG